MSEKWNWYGDEEKESTIVKSVQAIAVYSNQDGEIVIRQQDSLGDEDGYIVIPKLYVPALIESLKRELAQGS